jgi:hypothetical protein
MKSVRSFRLLAFVNAAAGALLMARAFFMIFSLISEPPGKKAVAIMLAVLLGFAEIVAVILLSCAIAHLKRPNRKSALNLAATTGVLVWMLSFAAFSAPALQAMFDPKQPVWLGLHCLVPIGFAFLVYRCWLTSSALRLFPMDEEDALPPAASID